jgi:ribosome maturation factor RimP
MAGTEEVAARIERLVESTLEGMGVQLVDVEYRFEGRWVLRLLIDRPNGVTLDDCAAVSGALGPLLDQDDPISNEYSLEVSSPGLFRPLRKPKHYRQALGKRAKLNLAPGALPERRQRQIRGIIAAASEEAVVIELDGERMELPFALIRNAKLDPEL